MSGFISRWLKSPEPAPEPDSPALCPLPRLLDLSAARRVMVFAPHPDDETIGCGGTLAQLATTAEVHAVLVTDGGGAGGLPAGSDIVRQQEFVAALGELGVRSHTLLGEPDGAFVDSPSFRTRVGRLLAEFCPDWVFLPSPLDYHRDHVRIAAALEALCRAAPSVRTLLFYEIWSPLPATHVVDVTASFAKKRAALLKHATPLAGRDYLSAVTGLNTYRALYLPDLSVPRMAEAFVVSGADEEPKFSTLMNLGFSLRRRLSSS